MGWIEKVVCRSLLVFRMAVAFVSDHCGIQANQCDKGSERTEHFEFHSEVLSFIGRHCSPVRVCFCKVVFWTGLETRPTK